MTDVSTIEDVAKRAGVSVATVSRALRGLPHVSPTTRARVKRIAQELDYRANPHASRLAARRSGTIGVALPILNSWFYGNVLAGIETVVAEDRLDMHLITVDGIPAMETFVAELPALAKKVDGLVIIDLFMPDEMWTALNASRMAVATIGLDTGRFDSVLIDNIAAARVAVDHLISLGHRRIAYIGGGIDEVLTFESASLRRQGMLEAMAFANLDPCQELAVHGGFTVEGGVEAMARLIKEDPTMTAVFCASDEMAMGAMKAVRDAGLEVPGDISVVGFDDHVVAEAVDLTTVHQPVSAMAARAAGMVLDRVDTDDGVLRRSVLDTRLIVRSSSGPVRSHD